MKTSKIVLPFLFISMVSCVSMKNSSGYIITNRSYGHNDYKETFCNDQEAVAWHEIDGFNYLGWVFFHLETEGYVVEIKDTVYKISIDEIIPLNVAQLEAKRIAKDAGFSSYGEFQEFSETQKKLSEEQREQELKQQEEERRLEIVRLRDETDQNFGVVGVGSLLHVKNGEVKIGEIIRLGDTFSYDMNYWIKSSNGGYLFGDFDEFDIRGLDMAQIKVKEIRPDYSGRWSIGGRMDPGGRRGYIVKYLGTEDVITQAGLRKVVWVFECIGGNVYSD